MGLSSDSKRDVSVKDDQFSIEGNLFLCAGTVIQLDNVSRVAVQKLPHPSYKWPIFFTFAAIVFFTISYSLSNVGRDMYYYYGYSRAIPNLFTTLAWVSLIAAVILFFTKYGKYSQNRYGLYIEVNSGTRIIYKAPSPMYLEKAVELLKKTLTEKTHGNYTFNVNNGTIVGVNSGTFNDNKKTIDESIHVSGRDNTVARRDAIRNRDGTVVTGNPTGDVINSVIKIDWSVLQDECQKIDNMISVNHNGVIPEDLVSSFDDVKQAVRAEDEGKLKDICRKLGKGSIAFLLDVGANVLADIITRTH